MADVKHNEGEIYISEINKLAELLKPVDRMRLIQALAGSHTYWRWYKFSTCNEWVD